ncbi:hypothetical protein ADK41_10740 [Streptomyces caelestis]|uniref:Uncharacterized protein n=1 Tax=Streptomyces caelestis TaxID=36816 RepID=A0A0M8QLA9_9ACTN|nr:hypothetical protein ADK41_10740 [Streptomyces caelestis]KOV33717.1 hypothetical protein ADK58_05500 [Streptomyces sp. XY152]
MLDADRLLHRMAAGLDLPGDVFGCTHLVRDDRPRVVVSLSLASRPLPDTLRERLAGYGAVFPGLPDEVGRAVLYPGVSTLTGTLTVAELLVGSAIARVTVLGTPEPPGPDTRVVTRDHVRPQWQRDELVLAATPALGGTLVPFEAPDPTPCCADH